MSWVYNYDEYRKKERIKEILLTVIPVSLIILFTILMLFYPMNYYHYEYIDLDNHKGEALDCSYKFTENIGLGGAGGQGSPICELKDGTIIQVKQYKQIYDYSCSPIDEWKGKC